MSGLFASMLKPVARMTRKRTRWGRAAIPAALLIGLAGSGLMIAAAHGWQITGGCGFGREHRYGGDDRGPIVRETIHLGFFSLRRSLPLPRWPSGFDAQRRALKRE